MLHLLSGLLMSKKIAFLFAMLILAASSLSVLVPINASSIENSWKTMASMPTARVGLGVAVVNAKIYAIGGACEGEDNVNEMYDPATNIWTTKQSMPTPRFYLAVTAYENKIYCIGGDPSTGATGANEVYDPATDTWTTKQSMPTPRRAMQANVVEGKIYLIGGDSGTPTCKDLSVNEVYDPASDTWTTKKLMPTAVAGSTSVVIDNMIYVMGNSAHNHTNSLVQIYDPKTDSWRNGTSPPKRLGGSAGAVTSGVWANRRVYVTGASDGLFSYNPCLAYDPETDSWSVGAAMPTARAYLGVAVVHDYLYAIGGTGLNYQEPPVSVNERYTPFGYGAVPPKVQVVSPEQNKTYASGNVFLTFTVDKPLVELSYSLNGRANMTIAGNTTLRGLSDGLYNVTVYAADLIDNMGVSQAVQFTVNIPPNISLLSPQNQTYTSTSVLLNFTVNKPVSYISYVLDGLENVTVNGNTTLTALGGDHNVTVYAVDEAGNVGASETISFSVDKPFPTALAVAATVTTITVVGECLGIYFNKHRLPSRKI
jgi:N-acetylneuraminic acid mutarotase